MPHSASITRLNRTSFFLTPSGELREVLNLFVWERSARWLYRFVVVCFNCPQRASSRVG